MLNSFLTAPALRITPPGRALTGSVVLPGSKSLTNRALLLAALANGRSHLTGALKSDDTARMAEALRAMGVGVEEPSETEFVAEGSGKLSAPSNPLFLGNAGTAMRFLTAAVSLVPGRVVLDGDEHMHKRPIQPLIAALNLLGVTAEATGGCPPVTVHGGPIRGSLVEVDASLSSQYVSALLMLAAMGSGPIEVALKGHDIGARGYVDLTVAAMRAFGAEVSHAGAGRWFVQPTGYRACDYSIEPDASAATYPWAWEQLTGGQIDLGFAPDAMTQPDAKAYELVKSFPHMPAVIDGSQMQDAVPTLAVLAAFNGAPVRFVGISNLRVKECDRVSALSNELNQIKPGLATEEGDDLVVNGDPSLASPAHPVRIRTYGDHRIAMAFALAGLRLSNIEIADPGCVAKTYPGYWSALAELGVLLTLVGE